MPFVLVTTPTELLASREICFLRSDLDLYLRVNKFSGRLLTSEKEKSSIRRLSERQIFSLDCQVVQMKAVICVCVCVWLPYI